MDALRMRFGCASDAHLVRAEAYRARCGALHAADCPVRTARFGLPGADCPVRTARCGLPGGVRRGMQVLHKAVIEVNEEGTEAAAATAAVMMTRSAVMVSPPRQFIVDRPFVLVIEDSTTGTPLFMGRVVSPQFTGLTQVVGA